MPTAVATLFDEEFLKKLEYLKLVSNRMMPGHLRGEHRARKKGTGIEFADYRPYVSGDDTKDVDWKAFLRLDKLIIRIFDEEADLPIYLFVDCSRSMSFGAPSKFDYARKVAAALAYIGLLNLDRVSIIGYSNGVAEQIASKRGRNQIWRIFSFLDGMETTGETSLHRTFRAYFGSKRRRGLVVVASDFMDPAGLEPAFDFLRLHRHDVFNVQILSTEEVSPQFPDEAMLVDSEIGGSQRLRLSPALLAAYDAEMKKHQSGIEGYCTKYGWGYVRTQTRVPFEDLIIQIFKQDRFLR
ncbi:MAG: DUF58 domain-containing protein [Vicinamibacteria bacterium]